MLIIDWSSDGCSSDLLIAETIAVFHGMLWLEPTALAPYLGFILEVPLWTAAPVAAIAIWLAFFLSYRIEEKSGQELPEPPAAIRDWLEAPDHRDRKSTRLNSSH